MYNYINNQVDSAVSVYITFYHLVLKMWLIRASNATGGDGKIYSMQTQSQGVMSVELVRLAYKVSRIMENLKLNKSDVI